MTLSSHRLNNGRVFHSASVISRATERYMSSTLRIAATNGGTVGAHHRYLEVQVEGPDVHVAGADDGRIVVDREVLGVQDGGVGVHEDPDAGLEQEAVVGVLGVGDHELFAFFTDEQLDSHSALRGRGDGVEK